MPIKPLHLESTVVVIVVESENNSHTWKGFIELNSTLESSFSQNGFQRFFVVVVFFPIVRRSGGESEITDEFLITTAAKIGEKDWVPLARELGFTKQEIRNVKKKYPHRSREQVYQMLVSWRHKMGQEATVAALELSKSNAGIETLSAQS